MDQPLFNVPNTPLDWVAAAPVTALPVPLTTAMLAADLARYMRCGPTAKARRTRCSTARRAAS